MKYLIIILASVSSLMITNTCFSQNFHTSSNKALKLYKEGMSAYEYFNYSRAERNFKEAVSIDNKFYEAYIMLGEMFSAQRRYSEASANYKAAIKVDSLFFKPVFFNLGNAEMLSGDYKNALIHFNVYIDQDGMSEKNISSAIQSVRNCEFALKAINNPISFNPVNIGSSINTGDDEYWPSITADGQTLMFTRQAAIEGKPLKNGQSHEDFYISSFVNDEWQKAYNAGAPINTSQNEGAQSISSNGNYMFFAACSRPDGLGSCDIYFSSFNGGAWSEPFNLRAPVNTSSWESQPSITADGNILFFSSNRPGGIGGKDIWYSVLNEKNLWSDPVNIGNSINTEGDEMSPFIHFDGKTLYFASDGRVGMGGFDIFMSKMTSDSTWTEPQNLGYPINSYSDEMGLVIESGGQKAYFSSIRSKSYGKDIFYFILDESVRPNPVSYMKGKVLDKETGKLLKANYELVNLSTGKVSIKSSTDAAGNFMVCLPSGYNYGINVNKEGYLFYSENFMFEGQHSVMKPYIKRITLSPIKVGEKMELSNVFYEIDSWQLKKESMLELDKLLNLMNVNKDIIVEIGGFTDSTGSDEYNLILSEKRALSVVNYLISKGISSERLKHKGFGNKSPIGDNVTAEGRKLNRRTEAKIIDLKK